MDLSSTKKRDIRRFGIIAFVFFGLLYTLGLWREKQIPIYLFGTLSVLGFGFILLPAQLSPIYSGWLKIAHFIGRIFTALMLLMAYYLVITPTALIKRMISGAPLPLKPDKDADSYWVGRTEPVQPKERFIKRY